MQIDGELDSTSLYAVRPSVAPQTSVTSHGTFWGTGRLPCTSGATVSVGLDNHAAARVEVSRKRDFMHTSSTDKADQVLHCLGKRVLALVMRRNILAQSAVIVLPTTSNL